ncbi:probable ATP-dependent RNA helicase DDX31 isoform X1 [Syngnathus typhle]|uniref:probable ATP-dependent RNA helicase DDX31 isoform X1 n=1 Tax=Syngnathus typhle TaxID=161592 RepID=UPI002A6A81B7|nr:probable ATP-dependent RNA helicase DDX31 isoform X1 [Syngnathus typhle]
MSSSDGQLCINITSCSPSTLPAAKRKRPPFKERCAKRARPQEAPPPAQVGRRLKADIKTSSLFRHNPEIPQVRRADVCPLTEKIFTSQSFSDLDLHPHLVATLNKVLNVSTLTSVQKQSIPALLSGRDAVVRSQTGSGKTLSFAVPLVQSLQGLPTKVRRSDGPLALVVVPTRELAQQTFGTFQRLLKPFTWIVPGALMGGEKRKSEKARLRKGINILVATPGRLVDHIQHTASIAFGAVRWLVLDEADRTLDLGFEKDLSIILNSLNATGSERQNVLLSATLTQGVTRLADICLKNPISVQVHEPAPDRPGPSAAAATAEGQWENFALPTGLRHFAVVVPSKVRLVCLATFLLHTCRGKKAMVFVSSCEEVDFLHSLFCGVLSAKLGGPLFLRLHGSMCQEERSEAFGDFLASEHRVLLCTDVAARGLHLPEVTWIIQYTPPCSVAEYVHRAGRTARMGLAGSSLLFLTPGESAFVDELARGGISLSEMKLPDILAHLMKDDAFKGRGKYRSQTSHGALEMETRERATVLQTHFEDFVHADATSLRNAKKARFPHPRPPPGPRRQELWPERRAARPRRRSPRRGWPAGSPERRKGTPKVASTAAAERQGRRRRVLRRSPIHHQEKEAGGATRDGLTTRHSREKYLAPPHTLHFNMKHGGLSRQAKAEVSNRFFFSAQAACTVVVQEAVMTVGFLYCSFFKMKEC